LSRSCHRESNENEHKERGKLERQKGHGEVGEPGGGVSRQPFVSPALRGFALLHPVVHSRCHRRAGQQVYHKGRAC